ncbi:MAG: transcriptional regulator [Gammaproteobacteria bacterium RIFCSPHIGHO2_12_FULL_42_13]|nr:MAG: transcriptional regulator [Gammaproteobacteria bacterium RIFCSPHIGHO2_12_FULL_42_13]
MIQADFERLLDSVREAGKIKRNEQRPSRTFRFTSLDIKKIREKTGLSQHQFSKLIHVSIKTLQNWEQGRRKPQGPALALLTILKNDPKHALIALS